MRIEQNFKKSKYKGYPEPTKARSFNSQKIGKTSLLIFLEQHSHTFVLSSS